MKTPGIVGGIGPESTIEYYRFILDGYRARVPNGSAPHLIIDSIDANHGSALLDADDPGSCTDYIAASFDRLVRAGAEVALIAANETTRGRGLKRLCLLGTPARAIFIPVLLSLGPNRTTPR